MPASTLLGVACVRLRGEQVRSNSDRNTRVLDDCPPPRGQKPLAWASNNLDLGLGLELHWPRLGRQLLISLINLNPQRKSRCIMIRINNHSNLALNLTLTLTLIPTLLTY